MATSYHAAAFPEDEPRRSLDNLDYDVTVRVGRLITLVAGAAVWACSSFTSGGESSSAEDAGAADSGLSDVGALDSADSSSEIVDAGPNPLLGIDVGDASLIQVVNFELTCADTLSPYQGTITHQDGIGHTGGGSCRVCIDDQRDGGNFSANSVFSSVGPPVGSLFEAHVWLRSAPDAALPSKISSTLATYQGAQGSSVDSTSEPIAPTDSWAHVIVRLPVASDAGTGARFYAYATGGPGSCFLIDDLVVLRQK